LDSSPFVFFFFFLFIQSYLNSKKGLAMLQPTTTTHPPAQIEEWHPPLVFHVANVRGG
jgi:hypothetical protein